MKRFFVYILTNYTNSVLYIGVTNNISRRADEHKSKNVDSFVKKYNLYKLVYVEVYYSISSAIAREKQLKKWKRQWKLDLIKTTNPTFQDLSMNENFIL